MWRGSCINIALPEWTNYQFLPCNSPPGRGRALRGNGVDPEVLQPITYCDMYKKTVIFRSKLTKILGVTVNLKLRLWRINRIRPTEKEWTWWNENDKQLTTTTKSTYRSILKERGLVAGLACMIMWEGLSLSDHKVMSHVYITCQ